MRNRSRLLSFPSQKVSVSCWFCLQICLPLSVHLPSSFPLLVWQLILNSEGPGSCPHSPQTSPASPAPSWPLTPLIGVRWVVPQAVQVWLLEVLLRKQILRTRWGSICRHRSTFRFHFIIGSSLRFLSCQRIRSSS